MRKQFLLVILLFSTLVLTSQPAGAQEASGPIYIVQPGDSLSSIAARFSVSLQELMAVNGITDPNQLAADQQLVIPGLEGVTVLSGGTDGEDGPTDAAGAICDGETLSILEEHQLSAADYLRRHDAYTVLDRIGGQTQNESPPTGLLRTGLTGTNVMDVRVILVR